MKKLIYILLAMITLQANAQQKWEKVSVGSSQSGIPGDPTSKYLANTGFGVGGDDIIAVCDDSVMVLNETAQTAVTLTILPTSGVVKSHVEGIKKFSNGLFYIFGKFPVGSLYYGIMVSDNTNPTGFSVMASSLITLQFASHPAQRGVTALSQFSYGQEPTDGYVIYGADLQTLNGTAIPSTIAFMSNAGFVTDLPQLKPRNERRNTPTSPVTNQRIRFLDKRVNSFSTNGDLLIGGNQDTLGSTPSHGLSSYNNLNSTLTDLNVTVKGGNQACTKYYVTSGHEYITWKNDNLPTNGGTSSPGLLEINSSNVIVGVYGGAPNLQGNCITFFDGKLWIGGSRYFMANPSTMYSMVGGIFTDASGIGANNIDNNGSETNYDVCSTPNYIYLTYNGQISLGDVSNFIAVQKRQPVVLLDLKLEYFRGAKQGSSHVLDWKVVPVNTLNGTVTLERSSDGRSFSSIYSITASAVRMQQPFNYATSNLLKGTNYYRLKLTDDNGVVTYSGIVALLNSSKGFELVNITPNPVTEGRFKLNITAAEQLKMEVVVTDMAGRIVSRQTNNLISGFNAIEVNVNTLANGMYQVMGIIEGERTRVVKFVKE